MTNNPNSYVVLVNPHRSELNFSDADLNPTHQAYLANPQWDSLTETLGIFAMLGPGTYTTRYIHDFLPTAPSPKATARRIGIAATLVPDEIITYDKEARTFTVPSDFSVAVALPQDGDAAIARQHARELTARNAAEREARQANLLAEHEREVAEEAAAVLAAEADKTSLQDYDHVSFTFEGNDYVLALISEEDMIAARIIDTLRQQAGTANLRKYEIVRQVWGAMPISEREIYGDVLTNRAPYAFDNVFDVVFGDLAERGLADGKRFITTKHHDTITTYGVSKQFTPELRFAVEEPAADSEYTEVQVSYYKHGWQQSIRDERAALAARKAQLEADSANAVADVEITYIDLGPEQLSLLDTVLQPEKGVIGHEAAIALLDIAMNPGYGKSLQEFLQTGQVSHESTERLKAELHKISETILGYESYAVAVADRTIGKHSWNRRNARHVQQVSGRLPGTTLRHAEGETDKARA